eukprot:gene3560-4487_t
MRVLAKHGDAELAHVVLQQQLDAGRPPRRSFSSSDVERWVKLWCAAAQPELAAAILQGFARLKLRVGPGYYNQVLGELGRQGRVDRAEAVLQEMQETGAVQPNVITFTTMLHIVGDAGRFQRVEELLEEMLAKGIRPNVVMYTSVMQIGCKAGRLEWAEAWLRRMLADVERLKQERWDTRVTQSVLTHLTHTCLEHAQVARAQRVLLGMCELGLIPDTAICNSVMSALCKTGELQLAEACLPELRRRGVKLDPRTFEVLLQGFGLVQDAQGLGRLMGEMAELGVVPTAVTHSVCALAMLRCMGEAGEGSVLGRLRGAGVVVDMCVGKVLVHELRKRGEASRAEALMSELLESGLQLEPGPLAALVRAQLEGGSVDGQDGTTRASATLIKQLAHYSREGWPGASASSSSASAAPLVTKQDDLSELTQGCNMVLQALGQKGELQSLHELLEAMWAANLVPDTVTHNTVIAALARNQRLDNAASWLEMVFADQSSAARPDLRSFTLLIGYHGKLGNLGKAERWLERLQQQGFEPDVVLFNVLIDMYGRARRLDRVEAVLRDMTHARVAPNKVTCTSVIQAAGRCGQLYLAEGLLHAVWEGLLAANQGIDAVWRSMLESSSSRALPAPDELTQQARRLLTELTEVQGIQADDVMLNVVINEVSKAAGRAYAEELLLVLPEWGLQPDLVAYQTVILAHCRLLDAGAVQRVMQDGEERFEGLLDRAACRSLLRQCDVQGVKVNVVLHDVTWGNTVQSGKHPLLRAFIRFGPVKEMSLLLHQAAASDAGPDGDIYTRWVEMLAREDSWDRASVLLQHMRENPAVPDPGAGAYNEVLGALGRRQRFEEAEALLWQMVESGVPRDEHTYALLVSLVDALREQGDAARMEKILQQRREDGISQAADTFQQDVFPVP